jgi:predicted kinase
VSRSLILLCGRSFSGKSTIASGIAAELNGALVSLDEINERRGLNSGAGIPLEEWQLTHAIATDEVVAALQADRFAVVDDTSSPKFLRDGWRTLADREAVGYVLVYVDTPVDELRRRRAANQLDRSRHEVTDEVFETHLAGFEAPAADEPHLIAPAPLDIPAWARTHFA